MEGLELREGLGWVCQSAQIHRRFLETPSWLVISRELLWTFRGTEAAVGPPLRKPHLIPLPS